MIQELQQKFPWPAKKPNVPENIFGWFGPPNQKTIERRLKSINPEVILELGAYLGKSTRFLCENSNALVITVDHWKGSKEHQKRPEVKTLYETFLVNCWEFQNRLIPVRLDICEGIQQCYELNCIPDLIYLDGPHDANSVKEQLIKCLKCFPNTHIIGDDWPWKTVREGVLQALDEVPGYTLVAYRRCYEVFK